METSKTTTILEEDGQMVIVEESSVKSASASEDWVDGLIRHDWSSGQVPPQIMTFGAPIVSGLWDQTHSFVSLFLLYF